MRRIWRLVMDSLKKVFLMGEPPDSPREATINPAAWELLRETLTLFLGLALVLGLLVVAWLTGQG
ncbi:MULTISPECIES: hypothetical protein [Thermaerobacter]|uniref:Uncharacterized protein n=1 Tax=Thermaerobacter composti TaxID=554949 RepID=A0ABZ0QQG1_9FIRM|nr:MULTISPECIES: hypothetical protein [Thermaerobacter]QBS37613.1 hypothetical protein E1B22_07225 [Thermaerobacter sp. FW80]WPD19736.1 hypothetical protein Q5761_03475 [Thermaerobacter composti]